MNFKFFSATAVALIAVSSSIAKPDPNCVPLRTKFDLHCENNLQDLKTTYEEEVAKCGDDMDCKVERLEQALGQREAIYLKLGRNNAVCHDGNLAAWSMVPKDDESYMTEDFKKFYDEIPEEFRKNSQRRQAEAEALDVVKNYKIGMPVTPEYFAQTAIANEIMVLGLHLYDWSNGVMTAARVKEIKDSVKAELWIKHVTEMPEKRKNDPKEEKFIMSELKKVFKHKILQLNISKDWTVYQENDKIFPTRRWKSVLVVVEDPLHQGEMVMVDVGRLNQEHVAKGKFGKNEFKLDISALNDDNFDNPCGPMLRIKK